MINLFRQPSLAPYFTKAFWQRNYPIWQDYDAWRSLGLPELTVGVAAAEQATTDATSIPQQSGRSTAIVLLYGILLGIALYVVTIRRHSILGWFRQKQSG